MLEGGGGNTAVSLIIQSVILYSHKMATLILYACWCSKTWVPQPYQQKCPPTHADGCCHCHVSVHTYVCVHGWTLTLKDEHYMPTALSTEMTSVYHLHIYGNKKWIHNAWEYIMTFYYCYCDKKWMHNAWEYIITFYYCCCGFFCVAAPWSNCLYINKQRRNTGKNIRCT